MTGKKISVIIASRNVKEDLQKCLEYLRKAHSAEELDVIVSDNNSSDGTQDMVRKSYPWVRFISSSDDSKYSCAINRGFRAATGDFILLLDSDVWIRENTIPHLVSFLESYSKAGVVVSKMCYPDGTVQMMARRFPSISNALFGRETLFTRLFPGNKISRRYLMEDELTKKNEPFKTDWASAACMMVRREVLEQAGLMDEGYLMYWADADWCHTIRDFGWEVYVLPEATVVHDMRNNANKKKSFFMIRAFHQGAYRYFRKHCIRSAIHPLNLFAIVGLSGRAGLQLLLNAVKTDKG